MHGGFREPGNRSEHAETLRPCRRRSRPCRRNSTSCKPPRRLRQPLAAPAPAKAAAPSWTANTTITGKAYFNVSNIDQKSDGADSATERHADGAQALLRRRRSQVQRHLLGQSSRPTSATMPTAPARTSWSMSRRPICRRSSPALSRPVGAADLPWVPFVEGLYGYRFVENTLIDRTKFGTSADWGVHACGTLRQGLVSYAGLGDQRRRLQDALAQLEHDRPRRPRQRQPDQAMTLAVGGYTGKLGKSDDNAGQRNAAPRNPLQRSRRLHRQARSAPASNISRPRTGTTSTHRSARQRQVATAGRRSARLPSRRRSRCSAATTGSSRARTSLPRR